MTTIIQSTTEPAGIRKFLFVFFQRTAATRRTVPLESETRREIPWALQLEPSTPSTISFCRCRTVQISTGVVVFGPRFSSMHALCTETPATQENHFKKIYIYIKSSSMTDYRNDCHHPTPSPRQVRGGKPYLCTPEVRMSKMKTWTHAQGVREANVTTATTLH